MRSIHPAHLVACLVVVAASAVTLARADPQFDWRSTYNLQKQDARYNPILNIGVTQDDCGVVYAARASRLAVTAIELTPKLAPVGSGERDTSPIVVVSGGRATYLKDRLSNVLPEKPKGLDDPSYWDRNDPRKRILWFDDRRVERPVYIVVDHREAEHYRSQLHDLVESRRITLVSCKAVVTNDVTSVGFGSQRMCAVYLMKQLGYRKAWMLDDNVARLGGLDDLGVVEGQLGENAAIAFVADETRDFNSLTDEQVKSLLAQHDGKNDPKAAETAVLQQLVLYNIAYLEENKINFSPFFVDSTEDVVLGDYLRSRKAGIKLLKYRVFKDESVTGDLNTEAVTTAKARIADAKAAIWNKDKELQVMAPLHVPRTLEQVLKPTTGVTVDVPVPALPRIGEVRVDPDTTDLASNRETYDATGRKIVEKIMRQCVKNGFDADGKLFRWPPNQ